MRLLPLALPVLALSLALPAAGRAADSTVFLPLKYVSPQEAEDTLMGDPPVKGASGVKVKTLDDLDLSKAPSWRFSPRLLPPGITSLSSDPIRHGLLLSGKPEDIEQVRNLLRLFDVPLRQFQLHASIIELNADTLAGVVTDHVMGAVADKSKFKLETAVLGKDALRKVTDRAARVVRTVEQTATNNRYTHLFLGLEKAELPAQATFWPRINGDGSVTVALEFRGGEGLAERSVAARRLQFGETLLIKLGEGQALLLTQQAPKE